MLSNQWDVDWKQSSKGVCTKKLLPSVNLPNHLKVITYQYQITQFMTGHGNFKSYLYNLKFVTNAQCNCRNGTDNVQHFIFYCREFNEQRKEFKTLAVKTCNTWPIPPTTFGRS